MGPKLRLSRVNGDSNGCIPFGAVGCLLLPGTMMCYMMPSLVHWDRIRLRSRVYSVLYVHEERVGRASVWGPSNLGYPTSVPYTLLCRTMMRRCSVDVIPCYALICLIWALICPDRGTWSQFKGIFCVEYSFREFSPL